VTTRGLTALALVLGTFAVTRVANAQSSYALTAFQKAENSTNTSFSYLVAHATDAQLEAATTYEATEATSNPSIAAVLGSDLNAVQSDLPSTPFGSSKTYPTNATGYLYIIPYITGQSAAPAAGTITSPGSGLNNAVFTADGLAITNAFADNLSDTAKITLSYYIGVGAEHLNISAATEASFIGAVAAQVTSTSLTAYYAEEIGIDGAYQAYLDNKNSPVIWDTAFDVANQTEGGAAPTYATEATISEAVGNGLGQLSITGTFVEQQLLNGNGQGLGGGSSNAATIAGALAAPYTKIAATIAALAAGQYQSVSPAISSTVANIDYTQIGLIATAVAQVTGTQYAASIATALTTVPNLANIYGKLGTPDGVRETVAEDIISEEPTTDAVVSGAVGLTVSSDAARYTLAYLIADQDAGLLTVNGVTLSNLNDVPAVTQAIEADVASGDTSRDSVSALISEYAAYPIWLAQYGSGKTKPNPAYSNVPASFYVNVALTGAQAQVGGNLPADVQAAIAGGVTVLFGPTNAIAITTSTAVEANALSVVGGGSDANAPSIVATFVKTTALTGDAQYLAAQAAVQYTDQTAAVSGSAATEAPAYAAVVGYQVALVSSTSYDAAVAHAIDESPGVVSYVSSKGASLTESTRETVGQDMIAAQPGVDAVIAGQVGQDLTSDADREVFVFLLADQLAGIDQYFAQPGSSQKLNLPGDLAPISSALASDLTSTGTALSAAVNELGIYAAYPLSPLDKKQTGTVDEAYIPGIANAIISTKIQGSYLSIANEASFDTAMVGSYGTEVPSGQTATVGSQIVTLLVNTSIAQNAGAAPTVAYDFASGLYSTATTYAPQIDFLTATGVSPIAAGQTGAAVIEAVQYAKGISVGALAAESATAANVIPVAPTNGITVAATEQNDNANYVAQGVAADSAYGTSGTTIDNYYDVAITTGLTALVSGSDRAAAGIASIFTNKISSIAYSATDAYYAELIATAAAKADPAQAPDILGYVIASFENTVTDSPYLTDASWNTIPAGKTTTPLQDMEKVILSDILAVIPSADTAAVQTAYNDIIAAGTNAVKTAYLAGDYGVITWNETPVVNE
jgi:hypothetical protein